MPKDDEFEEYLEYAIECRRRVKEQMNKRKPDDEFQNIQLSYFNSLNEEKIVFCQESQEAEATQNPRRVNLNDKENPESFLYTNTNSNINTISAPVNVDSTTVNQLIDNQGSKELKEQTITITHDATGFSYESLFSDYIKKEQNL